MEGTTARVRAAVIGVGHLGRHHARILAELPEAELVAVVDVDEARAREVGAACGVPALTDFRDVLGRVEAVSVAVPTSSHVEVALPLLQSGTAVLVEKPMAASVAEADRLVAAADRSGAVLAVGHTERHNPAVAAALPYVTAPRFIEGHRLGVFPNRSLDIDVIFDLMIHDLDIVLALVGSEVASIEAVGVPVLTGRIDIANVRLRFESGCIANLTASRISQDRVRKLRFFQPSTYVSIDYAAQSLEVWRLVREAAGRPRIEGGAVEVPREEPLKRQLADFLRAARGGAPPAVDGRAGRRALLLAERVTAAMLATHTA